MGGKEICIPISTVIDDYRFANVTLGVVPSPRRGA